MSDLPAGTATLGGGAARRVRGLRRWTLRTRLLVAVVAIAVVGLTAFGVLSVAALMRSELARIDGQLNSVAADMAAQSHPPPPPRSTSTVQGLPSTFQIQFFDSAGQQVGQIGVGANDLALPAMDRAAVEARGSKIFEVDDSHGTPWRVRTVAQPLNEDQPDGGQAAVVMPLDGYYATARELRIIELVAGAGLILVLGGVAAWLVRVGLLPLSRIEHTAEAIAAGDLERRVEYADTRTEVGRLGTAFNVMLERLSTTMRRLEESESRMRLFVADASHELRTPLTSIRGYAELYRMGGGADPAQVATMMRRIEDEAARMGVLVDDLLLLARLDEQRPLDLTDVDLSTVADEVVRDARVRQPERVVRLRLPDEPVHVVGDGHRLRQVLTNLVGNALVHTPAAARIDVRIRRGAVPAETAGGRADLPRTGAADVEPRGAGVVAAAGAELPAGAAAVIAEVSDTGPGIPPGKAEHVFDRFYRVDESRSRAGGSGLGLAIVAAVLTAHGARIQLLTGTGSGTTFRIVFPISDTPGATGRRSQETPS
ncbi:HAMP domain-containing sensor histidine kinase [Nocardia sp. NPDC004860]|uniref:sensor histidine kinase n=1 Tax=Nocardia sp. NPDC004860 TaxID=3154557 RepID=UPI0033A4DBB1